MFSVETFDIRHIGFEIFTAESQRIACVDNLDEKMGAFENTPQLAPHFEIAFEWCKQEPCCFLYSMHMSVRMMVVRENLLRQASPPEEERIAFLSLKLRRRHFACPWWSASQD